MNHVLAQLGLALWRLAPANPILVRVVHGASRRQRHLWLRAAYLSALLSVVIIKLVASLSGRSGSLAELAKGASETFAFASTTQLLLISFLAPVFTAAAITQEKDAQTFNILLSTPLTSAQIVFGSLFSRLYFVLMLLIAGLPIFLMTMAYGGVTTRQVLESFALSASTAFLTGSLAIFVAMMRVGTRGTIVSFYLLIGLYLVAVFQLGQWSLTWVAESSPNIRNAQMSWLTPLHPFLALDVSLNRINAPPFSHLGRFGATARFALAYPSAAYVTWTTCLALLLTTASIVFVRRGSKTGERTIWTAIRERLGRPAAESRSRPPRNVWQNPVAWREARTRGGTGWVLRWSIIGGGLAGSAALFFYYAGGSMTGDEVRLWLARWIVLQFAVAMIIATNTAATSMTKEKESKTMDLLLITPVTSKYIIWGKLRGLVSFAAPLLLGPVIVLLVFGCFGTKKGEAGPAIWLETFATIAALTTVYTACACIIGLRVSLWAKKNVTAVMYSVGALVLFCGGLTMLNVAIIAETGTEVGAFFAPFSPFTAVWYQVDPAQLYSNSKELLANAAATRAAFLIGSAIAMVLFTFFVWTIYVGLVRNFDMIVRKQSDT